MAKVRICDVCGQAENAHDGVKHPFSAPSDEALLPELNRVQAELDAARRLLGSLREQADRAKQANTPAAREAFAWYAIALIVR